MGCHLDIALPLSANGVKDTSNNLSIDSTCFTKKWNFWWNMTVACRSTALYSALPKHI